MSEEISELEQMRLVASDRLVWLRLLEKAVNDIDGVIGSLKNDVAEISRQVAARNEGLTLAPSEEETEEESDD
ncbi:MAG: hypothetical protein GOVbin709_20 [Prokaryotic dsDNA virus sp.]|nr:MAG: hypothetical protein GOVbin709_20 [Prokaryotic dsDNA virus sp.]|tara:strand:+ start:1287 stop:1505 length:219 start_codon:yes stop_codon:yes gene_type:complete